MATKKKTDAQIIREAARGTSSSGGSRTKARKEVKPLAAQVDAQTIRVAAMGGKVKKSGPSVLERIFEGLSRTGYAVAEGTRRAAVGGKGKSVVGQILGGPLDFARGAGHGITGHKKTNFNRALVDAGVMKQSKASAGVGLALDLVTDPLNFVGIGVVAKGANVAAQAKKAKAFEKAIRSKEAQKVADEAVYEAIDKYGKSAKKAEIPGAKAVTTPNYKQVAEKAKENYALNIARQAQDDYVKKTAGKVQLKVLGKPIYESEKIYKGIAKFGEPIGKSPLGQVINKGFRTKAMFPGDINRVRRMFEGMGVATYEEAVEKVIKPAFAHLTPEEKRMVSHAIEQRKLLPGYLGEAQAKAKALTDDWFDEEALDLGVIEPIGFKDEVKKTGPIFPKNPDYVYHFYRGRNKNYSKYKRARRAVGPETFSPEHARKIPTLADAKAAGLKPIEEIDDILAKRLQKNHEIRARKSFVNAISSEYGVKLTPARAKRLGLENVDSRFVDKQTYFPPEVAKALSSVEEFYDNDEVASFFLHHFDKIQRIWKTGATVVNPGHHVRNFSGDVALNWMDGVVDPRRYSKAMQILTAGDNLPNIKIKVGQKIFTGEDIMREFKMTGAKSGFFQTELNPTKISGPMHRIRKVAEFREDWTRLAHFIDALKKEGVNVKGPNDLRAVAEKATARVQHFNIDYGDLTPFERKVMRRTIPFYTFMRKNLPLQIESLFLRPHRLAAFPKTQNAIEDFLGTKGEDEDRIVPKWVKEMSSVLVRGEGEGTDALYWNPQLPVQDLGKYTEGGTQGVIGQLMASTSPAFRILAELGTGRKFFTGGPIGSLKQYAADQLPASRVATGSINPEKRSLYKILNWATGAGIQPITTDLQKSELRRRQDPLQVQVAKLKKKRSRAS